MSEPKKLTHDFAVTIALLMAFLGLLIVVVSDRTEADRQIAIKVDGP